MRKVFLLIIFFMTILIKILIIAKNANLNEETGLFWTESALQYRNARLIAEKGFLPTIDRKAQYPEGLNIKDRLTTLMEFTAGYIYRFLIPDRIPFHVYLIFFISVFSSLSIVPLYLTANHFLKNSYFSVLITGIYAFTPAFYTTVTSPGFELQDFALPLIFFHFYLLIRSRKDIASAYLSGAFLFAALASWHLTQFYYLLLVGYLSLKLLFNREFKIRRFYPIFISYLLAGLLIPSQRSAYLIVSFPALVTYTLVLSCFIRRLHLRRIVFLTLIGVSVIIAKIITTTLVPEYQFVYGLMLNKIRHLGIRPRGPSGLSWETLVMWVSPFTGPDLRTILGSLAATLPFGLIGMSIGTYHLIRLRKDLIGEIFLYFPAFFLPLYLLFIRMDAFLIWFLASAIIYLLILSPKIYPLLFGGVCINLIITLLPQDRIIGPQRNYLIDIIRYVRYNTNWNDPILTSFPYGPTILTDTDRPIILHPKFEAVGITEKIKDFEHLLYGDEDKFYQFCRNQGASFFLYQIDMLLARNPESIRFRTHNLSLSKKSLCYKFHFQPEALRYFDLVYTNPHYRLYKILVEHERPSRKGAVYYRIYDENRFRMSEIGIKE